MPQQTSAQTGFILTPDQFARLQAAGQQVQSIWTPNRRPDGYSMQADVLTRLEDEILTAGGLGGGKSACAIVWAIKGNHDLPEYDENGQPILVNQSYLYHPHYHGLFLRRNLIDMREFIDRAKIFYKPYGVEFVNGRFESPSGAIIDCGHLQDKDSWQKYIGQEYQRIIIEEAATIPEFDLYEEIKGRLRTSWPELRCQILLTANPKGPGLDWLIKRFMEVKGPDGKNIPPGTTIREEVIDPRDGSKHERTRVWIFSTILDNPKVDSGYIVNLASMEERRREAYLMGNWRAYSGDVFKMWRPNGPQPGEPPNANHVIRVPHPALPPWWPRFIGFDWGFKHHSAIVWGCQDPATHQIHVYRELVVNMVTPEQLGYEVARRSVEELRAAPTHAINLFLSPDAFSDRSGDLSQAEMIARGIARVIGPTAVHVPEMAVRRLQLAYERGEAEFQSEEERAGAFADLRGAQQMGITLRAANDSRVMGWQYMQDCMRFLPVGERLTAGFDQEMANQILMKEGPEKYTEYVRAFSVMKDEVLPRLQVWDTCPEIIAAIPKLVYNDAPGKCAEDVMKSAAKYDDVADGLRYLLVGIRDTEIIEPFDSVWERRHAQIIHSNPSMSFNDKCRLYDRMQAEWREKNGSGEPFRLRRVSQQGRALRRPVPDSMRQI